MNRDPANHEITRDPIFILLTGRRHWIEMPEGSGCDGESIWFSLECEPPEWIKPFLDCDALTVDQTDAFWKAAESQENEWGHPIVYTQWHPEAVFLTRPEAEAFAKAREYRWELWKVYCVPCEGDLAKILTDLPAPAEAGS